MAITILGGGLAGCEAAWQLVKRGTRVRLIEMKPERFSPAHESENLGELVCSNSFRSASLNSAAGLLKEEMRLMDSLIVTAARATSVPAGKALAVDRERFSRFITERISGNPLVTLERREITRIPHVEEGTVIVATGPLTSDSLADDIARSVGADGLSFYDAIAPIVEADSLDMNKLFSASRYEEGEGDYLNAPMDEETYRRFVDAVIWAQKVDPYPFEKIPHFEGCLPIEEIARRGPDTLAFGPMKPVGLIDPATGRRPYAVVQLRAENREKTLYNLVGFQTKMTHPEQEKMFRTIPGLESATFARLGSIHRNTYLDAPRLLDRFSRSTALPHVFFAGQITGVEGYIESAASGLIVGIMAGLCARGITPEPPPSSTAVGGLLKHTRDTTPKKYEPMNVNFGLMDAPPPGTTKKRKKEVLAAAAIAEIRKWIGRVDKLWEEEEGEKGAVVF
ncbi:MAG: methylenetetrahydrofolate--tRNA-(uracil(54)-C(5))-methyltransferase (FADH(2)-oxidizing) TrmFO [Desulfomonilaceae bacterium]|nr:methylenetetrahydrofolate--tRNA-(uracil(54)-C(5))-methyltransferase (FADH(2)-oxidizing) TrmFO [Desulfomonilaceae bacterium]